MFLQAEKPPAPLQPRDTSDRQLPPAVLSGISTFSRRSIRTLYTMTSALRSAAGPYGPQAESGTVGRTSLHMQTKRARHAAKARCAGKSRIREAIVEVAVCYATASYYAHGIIGGSTRDAHRLPQATLQPSVACRVLNLRMNVNGS